MASSIPFSAPSVTLFMSGSSTYSLLMWATTSLNTPMCLRVSSELDAPLPSPIPIRSRMVRHDDVLTTKYLMRLLIGVFEMLSGGLKAIILLDALPPVWVLVSSHSLAPARYIRRVVPPPVRCLERLSGVRQTAGLRA